MKKNLNSIYESINIWDSVNFSSISKLTGQLKNKILESLGISDDSQIESFRIKSKDKVFDGSAREVYLGVIKDICSDTSNASLLENVGVIYSQDKTVSSPSDHKNVEGTDYYAYINCNKTLFIVRIIKIFLIVNENLLKEYDLEYELKDGEGSASNAETEFIKEAIQNYKDNIDKYWNNEQYKWVAVKWFQDNWRDNSDDFAEMLNSALGKSYNLLNGSMYLPQKMIYELALSNPTKVKGLFNCLYNEDLQLEERIQTFRDGCDELVKERQSEKTISHYQDLRAVCVYLSFKYPDKYYLYKAGMYNGFKKKVGFKEKNIGSSNVIKKYGNFSALCNDIVNVIKKDEELISKQQELIQATGNCYEDPEFHVLAQTIMYVNSGDYGEVEKSDEFFPSKSDYDPGFSSEKWLEILGDKEVTADDTLRMLAMMYDYGKPATCLVLSNCYGEPANFFNKRSSAYAKKIHEKYKCPVLTKEKDENAKWWPILFVGRKAKDDEEGTYAWKLRDELNTALGLMELPKISKKSEKGNNMSLNTILYGPPGTGKTYNTIKYAVAICDEISIDEVEAMGYKKAKERFDELKAPEVGRIAFTTFHQSYGYEDFIEGIRPVMQDEESLSNSLEYRIEAGVFKKFCEKAGGKQYSGSIAQLKENPAVWKVSLGGSGDSSVKRDCFNNNRIRIGWPERDRFITDESECNSSKERTILTDFEYSMEIGDLVAVLHSQNDVDAIGVVTGEYEWLEDGGEYPRSRKVEWLAKDIRLDIRELNNGKVMTLSAVYRLGVNANELIRKLKDYDSSLTIKVEEKKEKYVFIIDEINRGNISKIFGELITLIEETKREGKEEEAYAILPYSHSYFSIPENVYVIGTMNTADRSIALMDTALRRRFKFIEMMPDISLLKDVVVSQNNISINIADVLKTINERIEFLFDREHTIGHAFFMDLKNNPSMEKLADIFKHSVIPLLQEYFYDDYEKIQLVLGDNGKTEEKYKFIKSETIAPSNLFKGHAKLEKTVRYYIDINDEAFNCIESYAGILNTPVNVEEDVVTVDKSEDE